jgi:teichuronic acid biosynthesis glycosyltransferase TuaC
VRVLVVTNLFPTPTETYRGVFVAKAVERLARHCEVRVVCPLPWFPRWRPLRRLERWYRFAEVPASGDWHGVPVHYPKYPMLPKVGEAYHARLLSLGLRGAVARIHRAWPFDLINAHWLYPDGVAAQWEAARLGVPIVLSARGCDLNLFSTQPALYRQIEPSLRAAARITVVSEALAERLVTLGFARDGIDVIPNGVDRDVFHLLDRAACRAELGVPARGRAILFVGQLLPVKGFPQLIEAVAGMPGDDGKTHVYVVGEGPEEGSYRAEMARRGVAERFTFLGKRDHAELVKWLGACDLLTLPSVREGRPNVVIEALACGRPVVATRVGGIPELVSDGENGYLFPYGDVDAYREALERALGRAWEPDAIAASVAGLSWDATAEQLARSLSRALETGRA